MLEPLLLPSPPSEQAGYLLPSPVEEQDGGLQVREGGAVSQVRPGLRVSWPLHAYSPRMGQAWTKSQTSFPPGASLGDHPGGLAALSLNQHS